MKPAATVINALFPSGVVSVKMIRLWLQENVRKCAPCDHVSLDRFEWPRLETYFGKFSATLGADPRRETFGFGADGSGQIQLYFPLFHSPMGVPASYAAIELPAETETALLHGVRAVVPRLKPYGIDPQSKRLLTTRTPLSELADFAISDVRDRLLRDSFCVKVDTETLAVEVYG